MPGAPGRSGRRPLPNAVKKLRGNPGKRKLNPAEPQPAQGEPVMPAGLSPLAQQEWRAILPDLTLLGVLARIDGKALAAYCMAWSRWMQAEAEVERLGLIIEEPIIGRDQDGESYEIGTRYKRNPAIGVGHEAMKIMKSFLIEFGMTPASRSRIRIEKPKEEDPLEAFLKRGTTQSVSVN